MRAKSEIKSNLSSKLTSDIWEKLKNSLLGRELIAFGAEVLSENENIKDTMLQQLNPETADKNGLYLLSQMNEIPITNVKPSTLVVEMMSNIKTYAPFELGYNIGNVAFTNIEYTMQGKTISLYNGTHKCYVKGNLSLSENAQSDGEDTYFYDGGDSYSGIKLGNAYPDSIIVTDENDLEIPRYSSDIALSNEIGVMYKVVTNVDGGICIRFICNEDYEIPARYKIDWLDHSASDFDVESVDVIVNNENIATIKYYSRGVVDSLDYMRLQLKKEMAKYNGFNTPKSVEQYVKGLPYVLDAKCERGTEGVNVYIKPSSYLDLQTYLDFSEIAAHISLNSLLFPNIKVRTGKQILFGIEISGIEDVKLQKGIRKLLQDKFSYTNMTFNTIINTGNILSEIYGKYNVVPTVNMTIKETFRQDKPLSFKPIKNSLKLYGVNNMVVAWEENGLLYGMANNSNQIPFFMYKVVGCMGTMFLLMLDGEKRNVDTKTKNYYNLIGVSGDVVEGYYYNDKFYSDSGHTTLIEPESDTNDIYKDITTENYIFYKYDSKNQTYIEVAKGDISNGGEYSTYDSDIEFSMASYNRFYLYDASTNVIKPFDGIMQNLLYTDTNPSLKYNAWNTDEQSFGNLYDINFLSTNNALVVQMVFKDSGADVDETDGNNPKLKYWSKNNMLLYNDYLYGSYVGFESNSDYAGKYQTTFFIDNPLALKKSNYESWQIFQDASHGSPYATNGLYKGLRNINNKNTKLNIKSNWFVHNNKQYYAYEISDKYVYITNGAKNLAVSLNGSFLGMIPYEGDLYVINEKYITKIVGFEGLKEKEEIYQIYKDYNTPITITDIIREFDNQIVFKTITNEFYTATGFKVIDGNKISFLNLKQIFNDGVVIGENNEVKVDLSKCKIGGCTKDYVSLYDVIEDDKETSLNETGFIFYCYDINAQRTFIHNKTSNFESVSDETENSDVQNIEEVENVAVWWGKSDSVITEYSQKSGYFYGSRLFYYDENGDYGEIPKEKYKDLFFVKVNSGDNGGVLCVDNIDGKQYSYQVFVAGGYLVKKDGTIEDAYSFSNNKKIVSGKNLLWSYDGDGIDSDYIAGFYKQCIDSMQLLERSSKLGIAVDENYGKQPDGKPFYNLFSRSNKIKTIDGFLLKTEKQELRNVSIEVQKTDGVKENYSDKNYEMLISNKVLNNNEGEGYLTDVATAYTPNKTVYFKSKTYGKQGVVTEGIETFKILTKKYYTLTTSEVSVRNDVNYEQSDDSKELITIGYFDEGKNSCVNSRGSDVAYLKYHTQNPNVSNDSYLVLDETEINFI